MPVCVYNEYYYNMVLVKPTRRVGGFTFNPFGATVRLGVFGRPHGAWAEEAVGP